MALTSALGYITAARQSALGSPRAVSGKAWTSTPAGKFFRYLSSPKGSAEMTNNRFREGGGKRDVSLSLKEGLSHNISFPLFARPTVMGFLMAAATGPAGLGGLAGGGTMSNGLVCSPKLATSGGNTTLSTLCVAGATTIDVASITNFSVSDKIVIGWGPNMEFVTLHGSTAPSGSTITLLAALKYPHAVGEPVYEVNGYGTLSAAVAVGATSFSMNTGHGFGDGVRDLAISSRFDSAGTYLGSEYGNSEMWQNATTVVIVTISTTAVALTGSGNPTVRNGHSADSWVYEPDISSTTRVHCFEPMNALGSSLDYYTIERAVGSQIVERIQDTKLGQFEVSGESPGAVRATLNWLGRFAKTYQKTDGPMTEDYTNQDPTADLPFRMPNGKYVIQIGSSTGMSSKMKQFNFNASNMIAEDIYTDQIYRDELLDLAREANFGAQFYFNTKAEYMETYYGAADPADASSPASVATAATVLMDLSISTSARMCVFIPALTWETFPVEIDPEPKPIIVDAAGVPLASGSKPLYLVAIQNKDTSAY